MNKEYLLDINYIEALEYCKSIQKESQGITSLSSPKISETVLIQQNNLIITLLVGLHKKIDNLYKKKTLIPEDTTSTSELENSLKDITGKLDNLSLNKTTGKEVVTRRLPKNLKFQR